MRKALAIGTTSLALMFGGAGVAHATELAPAATTTVAQDATQDDDGDNTGLWGLAGLLGLLGLAGLKRRKDVDHPTARGTVPPRV
ncbi:MAG: WGxxGxxG family protein [Actinomycetota bacterium]